MGVVTSTTLGLLRRFVEIWRTDITDVSQMARLRALIIWMGAALGLVAASVSFTFSRQTFETRDRFVPVAIVSGLVVIVLYAVVRGPRMKDPEFFALIAFVHLYAAFAVGLGQGRGEVASTALALVGPTVLGALFLDQRRWVLLEWVVTVAVLGVVAGTALPGSSAVVDASNGCFALVVVTGVVRLLRDLAINALRRALKGEVTDPLTGLTNRLGLERMGGPYWSNQAFENSSIAVLVVDVDHFKRVNDTQGHVAGDKILRRLGEILAASIRPGDLAVRLGGEEFLILARVDPGKALAMAERIRSSIETEMAPTTVSIGVHETQPIIDDPIPTLLWSVIDLADQALYIAKNSGRNRVHSAPPDGRHPGPPDLSLPRRRQPGVHRANRAVHKSSTDG